jgi:hypothetical protein
MKSKKDYTTESIQLAKAVDIAMDAFQKHPPSDYSQDQLAQIISSYLVWKEQVLNPEPPFRKLASLKYLQEAIFTFFQEANGPLVDYFWENIKMMNLDYVRQDRLYKILKRGKINGHSEYDYVTDIIVAAEQEGKITKDESAQLCRMIEDYLQRRKK